jgi:hypothetical protein
LLLVIYVYFLPFLFATSASTVLKEDKVLTIISGHSVEANTQEKQPSFRAHFFYHLSRQKPIEINPSAKI